MSHYLAVTQQIRAIEVWNPCIQQATPLSYEGELDEALCLELKKLQEDILREQESAKKKLNDDLTRVADYYDEIWKLHDQVASQSGYSIVNGLYECPNLKQYISVCQKLEIGREGSAILAELEAIERSLKNNELKNAVQQIVALDLKINSTRVLRGFKNHISKQIDALIEGCQHMILKILKNTDSGSNSLTFNTCVDLLISSCTLSRLKGKPLDYELIAAVAHELWFTLDKWRLPTPPDYKWLETESYTTASALYYNLENLPIQQDSSIKKQVTEDLLSAGLTELFFRYLSYRSSDDIIFRASDFLTNVMAIATSPKLSSQWQTLSSRAMRDAWAQAITPAELNERCHIDKERILDQLASKAEMTDVCPINGVNVQVKVVAAVALAIQLIRRVQLIMDESSLRTYLDSTLNQALVKTVLDDLKYQWNAMDDPWQNENLNESFCIFNSVCHMHRSLLIENQAPNSKMMESITSTKNRIITLLLEELALSTDLITLSQDSQKLELCPDLFSRARSAIAMEDMQEILMQTTRF